MRLLNTESLAIEDFLESKKPFYAILSHTWEKEELSYQDMTLHRSSVETKPGFAKLLGAASRAKQDGHRYIWIDTCCIDKTSSVELSEAINSMYRWYKEAQVCYAYLSDVPPDDEWHITNEAFETSRWFKRGWTLQELIAPAFVEFYAYDWTEIGTKSSLRHVIWNITGIETSVLRGESPSVFNVAERMSWAANRETTRIEDEAYCLLGLFNIHMPLLYGEGRQSFIRLQEEILRVTEDYSLLAWAAIPSYLVQGHGISSYSYETGFCGIFNVGGPGILAWRPAVFSLDHRGLDTYSSIKSTAVPGKPPTLTSRGLKICTALKRHETHKWLAFINCTLGDRGICIALEQLSSGTYRRIASFFDSYHFPLYSDVLDMDFHSIYIERISKPLQLSDILHSGIYMQVNIDLGSMTDMNDTEQRLVTEYIPSIEDGMNAWNITGMNVNEQRLVTANRRSSHELYFGGTRSSLFWLYCPQFRIILERDDVVVIWYESQDRSKSLAVVLGQQWCDILSSISLRARYRCETLVAGRGSGSGVDGPNETLERLVSDYRTRCRVLDDSPCCLNLGNDRITAAIKRKEGLNTILVRSEKVAGLILS
ncbi:heterokaryon incompatibility protein-domain-containing protein [Xylariaceae sp. FL0016]|nr:heterokaryon incompatibility protein-domain-containing protein [Xylariaceae sp. FL0016]